MSEVGSFKRIVEVRTVLNIRLDEAWKMIENVRGYSRYVKFMKSSQVEGAFVKGNYWTDISTVMFLPLKVTHEIIEVKKGRKAVFLIKTPFGGRIIQEISMESIQGGTNIRISANINPGNKLLDLLLGRFIERRTRDMFAGTLENFQKNNK